MPDLVNTDGETVAPSLTKEEIEVLAENGVEFDLSEPEDGEMRDDEDGEAIPHEDGDESIDELDEYEADSGASGESTDDADGVSEPGDESEGGSEGFGSDESADGDSGESEPSESGESEPGEMGETDASESGGGSLDESAGDRPDEVGEVEVEEIGEGDGEDGGARPDEVTGELDEYEHSIDPADELAEEIADRGEDELADKFDVEVDEIHRTDERDIERWHRLLKKLDEYGTDVEKRKRERDERIGSTRVRQDSEKLEQRAKQSGAISDLKNGFRKLVSRPTPRPATAGPQIDPYNVTRRAAGDMTIQELFEERVEVETGERCVGLATDISGSMRSDITELKIAGGVIAEATQIIGDDFVWEAFTDRYSKRHTPSEERLDLRIVTGPNEKFEWEHVDSFTNCYNEPTAAGIRDCRMLMEQTSARQNVMIVITDGVTLVEEDGTFSGRSGAPVEHARQAVKECRRDGFDVIGLGIGGMDEEKMLETFGEDQRGNPNYRLTDIDSLAEDVLEIYREQMNVTRR